MLHATKEIVDLSHELFDVMINLGAKHFAFWPLESLPRQGIFKRGTSDFEAA
jgi:hypothetical protein